MWIDLLSQNLRNRTPWRRQYTQLDITCTERAKPYPKPATRYDENSTCYALRLSLQHVACLDWSVGQTGGRSSPEILDTQCRCDGSISDQILIRRKIVALKTKIFISPYNGYNIYNDNTTKKLN